MSASGMDGAAFVGDRTVDVDSELHAENTAKIRGNHMKRDTKPLLSVYEVRTHIISGSDRRLSDNQIVGDGG